MKSKFRSGVLLAVGLLAVGGRVAAAKSVTVGEAQQVVSQYKTTDPGLDKFFKSSAGYVVFPGIAKGGFVVGAASGDGILFEKGKAQGKATMTQVSVGAQIGGQTYSEVIFFQDNAALQKFKSSNLEFAAQVSAVGLKSGVSSNAKYDNGVLVMTAAQGGLMLEASVGGQKFKYTPFPGTS
jgi:lipid-binding SYLF domain-containing protein